MASETEKKLIEKIDEVIFLGELHHKMRGNVAEEIVDKVIFRLPELARERRYVKLADDQELPQNAYKTDKSILKSDKTTNALVTANVAYNEAQKNMIKGDSKRVWRAIDRDSLEVKDGFSGC